jgi:Mce-associated membrane protein
MTGLEITEFTGAEVEPAGQCLDPTAAGQSASRAMAANDASGRHRRGAPSTRRARWSRVLARGVLPAAALGLAVVAGYFNWVDGSAPQSDLARVASVQAASGSTAALLSYTHDTVDNDVAAARERLTGNFKDAYTSLTHDVVIPGAKQKQISVTATVPAAASLSASENHAVVLVFADQTLTMGNEAPSNTASSVRVTLDKVDGRWLISQFDPM